MSASRSDHSQSLPSPADPLALAGALIRCPSVTPVEGGALDLLQAVLTQMGFVCERMRFTDETSPAVDNLYARRGTEAPHFCFAGHTDVVPVGEEKQWTVPPFAGEVRNGELRGRGAADMKSAIAAFVAALARLDGAYRGSVSLLITGDEEGPAVNGTRKMLLALKERGEKLDHCLVGEPTSRTVPGDTLKIGRRGSLNLQLTVTGKGGHSAYPQLANNPLPALSAMLAELASAPLDDGSAHFEPSTLQITSIDVGNNATNVIPERGTARMNVRFNDLHTPQSLQVRFEAQCGKIAGHFGVSYELDMSVSGTAFLTRPGAFTEMLMGSVEAVTGRRPELSTGGGTSDARFIKDYCEVAELGLAGQTMHKIDERVPVADIDLLTRIYEHVLRSYFAAPPPSHAGNSNQV
jgi:succinyl-diaminopimelate desuccinylase